jgi:HAMP domain-containing protein
VEDRAGKIFAHSFDVFPRAVRGGSSSGAHAIESLSTVRLGDRDAYEISVPISEGRDGAVRVGFWREQVDAKISETVIPLINLVVLVLSGGALMAIFLVWQITRPIRRLVAAAKAISSGDLDTPSPQVEDSNEFGELSRAIERMRSSVKAAMVRLSR